MKKLLLLMVALCLLVSCKSGFNTAPLLNFPDQPVQATLSMEEMERCIVTAGAGLGWVIAKSGDGLLEGAVQRRGHSAEISIAYSATSYSIMYKNSSAGLYYDPAEGTIHKTYNTWVNNLARQINANIVNAAYRK